MSYLNNIPFSNALITGATGFIGSRLTQSLLAQGIAVHALLRPDSATALLPQHPNLTLHRWNGTVPHMTDIVKQSHPEIIFHLASLFLASHKPDDIPRLIDANLTFGTILLESLIHAHDSSRGVNGKGLPPFINTGTSWEHFEGALYRPVNLYAATKQAFESLLAYYIDAEGLRTITLKLFDTYGPGDPRPKLLSLLVRAAREQKILDMSPGGQLLDLVYIDDVIVAFLIAARRTQTLAPRTHERFAVGADSRVTLRQLVDTMNAALGIRVPVNFGGRPYRNREVMKPWSNAPRLPDWAPVTSLERGLIATFSVSP